MCPPFPSQPSLEFKGLSSHSDAVFPVGVSRNIFVFSVLLTLGCGLFPPEWLATANVATNSLQIQSVLVGGKGKRWRPGGVLRLGSSPVTVSFNFGPSTGSNWQPTRLRYRLEGYDNTWQEGLVA